MTKLLYNANIVNEEQDFIGSILIENDRIIKIFREAYPNVDSKEKEDFNGDWLFPGVIDDQVHFREPGLTHKGDIETESSAAVAGGITSYLEMPNTNPQTTTAQLIIDKHNIALGRSAANFSFYLGATNTNIGEILKVDTQKVCGIKVFMGSSTGNMLVNNIDSLNEIFSQSPLIIATHCEDEAIIQKNSAKVKALYGNNVDVKYHSLVRDEEACYKSSSLAVELAIKHSSRLHVLHISSEKEMNLFSTLPLNKKKITTEVCTHHLWFTDEDYAKLGSRIKWNPSIKSINDREALRESLRLGKIDVVATDHAPHLLSEKEGGCFNAASGGPLVQHSLLALLELYHKGVFSLKLIVNKMCHNPAYIFQIKDRGYIREGYFADIVRVRKECSFVVDKINILYKCNWSPFEGQKFTSQVIQTYVNGKLVYKDGKVLSNSEGIALTFNR